LCRLKYPVHSPLWVASYCRTQGSLLNYKMLGKFICVWLVRVGIIFLKKYEILERFWSFSMSWSCKSFGNKSNYRSAVKAKSELTENVITTYCDILPCHHNIFSKPWQKDIEVDFSVGFAGIHLVYVYCIQYSYDLFLRWKLRAKIIEIWNQNWVKIKNFFHENSNKNLRVFKGAFGNYKIMHFSLSWLCIHLKIVPIHDCIFSQHNWLDFTCTVWWLLNKFVNKGVSGFSTTVLTRI
jgi:hypothetical protein